MGRRNFGRKKKTNHQKKQKKGSRKSSKDYPGIPQELVTCRELAIYVPPEDEADRESDSDDDYNDYYDDPQFYDNDRFNYFNIHHYIFQSMLHRIFETIVLSEMMGNRGGQPSGFSRRRARR